MRLKLLLVVIAAIATAVVVVLLWQRFFAPQKATIDTSRTAVIKEIRALNRLETASFTIEKVIEGGTNGDNAFSQLLFGDKILLIAHGQVIAGFDLATLPDESIEVDGKTITLTLPPPQILFARLDSEKTRVYDRRQGLLNRGDKDLESEARAAAEESIQKAACEAGILDEATQNARKQLTTLFKALQFETVTITIPPGNC
jgi:hypothetical protein